MRDRLRSFPELRIFCQNVNRHYGYMDTLLASLYDKYDLLFIQEPPWQRIRSAPSPLLCDGEDVIGPPISPNWGVIHRPSSLEEPPRDQHPPQHRVMVRMLLDPPSALTGA
jgi:hypothetical protein